MLSKHEEQAERLDVLENEKRLKRGGTPDIQGSTFLSHTHNDIGGRFAAISSPQVVGEKQIPKYPAAYLQHDPVPDEPALGVDINEMEPCGQPHELRASISSLEPSSLPSPVQAPLGPLPLAKAATPSPSSQVVPPLADERLGFSAYRRF